MEAAVAEQSSGSPSSPAQSPASGRRTSLLGRIMGVSGVEAATPEHANSPPGSPSAGATLGRRISFLERFMGVSGGRRPSFMGNFGGIDRQSSGDSLSADEDNIDMRHSRSLSKRTVTAGFIKSETKDSSTMDAGGITKYRRIVEHFMTSIPFDVCLGIIVIFDIAMNIMSIDARSTGSALPKWLAPASYCTLAIYTIEFAGNVFSKLCTIFCEPWVMVDLVILVAAYGELALEGAGISLDSVGMLRVLRIIRIMRLIKLFRKFIFLKELRKLVLMAASCVKTLCWSFLFCFVVMTVWAMATVELVHPIVKELVHEKELDDWESTETVMKANLLLFKTVIAGDSWGAVAVPVITRSPLTFIIFVGSQLTIVFGVLNLVVAVVVDTFAEQRQKDVENLAQEMEIDEAMDLKLLSKIFEKIDEDNSGELSLEELMQGAKKVPEFQSRLRVMDIDEQDLEQLFYMIDSDGGGSIDPNEFISALSRWIHTSKSATRFVKYNVERTLAEQQEMTLMVRELKQSVDKLRGDSKRKTRTIEKLQRQGSPYTSETPVHEKENASHDHGADTSMNIDDVRKMVNAATADLLKSEDFRHALRAAAEDVRATHLLHEQAALEDVEDALRSAFSRMQQVLCDAKAFPEAESEGHNAESTQIAACMHRPKSSSRKVRLSTAKWADDARTETPETEDISENNLMCTSDIREKAAGFALDSLADRSGLEFAYSPRSVYVRSEKLEEIDERDSELPQF
eukprot:TRINITY_DN15884_c0_g1_i3.p1 TRINITY_DN15884_c0_g1~~TRINITY_DN15884_c0_g1_i3.p1  ORF type:complete len:761 (-),score=134.45 TRINITY_DN15884_c0_g1_i3:253-2478(-)